MSAMIEEISVDRIPDVAPDYPLERVQFMFEKYPDSDIYLQCKGCSPYLLVRTDVTKYSFYGGESYSTYRDNAYCSAMDWAAYARRSYKIIRDTGALPYAHRS